MLISDWSSDVCSSDLGATLPLSGSGQVVNRLAGDEAARLLRLATTASVVTAVLLILVKLVAFLLTDSVSILSTLLDSLLHGAASLVTLIAVRHALVPADREPRFGPRTHQTLAALGQAASPPAP